MHLLSWADNRTIIACHCLLALGIGMMLLIARRLHPQLEGVGSLALGCFLVVPTVILLALIGIVPDFWSKTCATELLFLGYIMLYRGILRFCSARNNRLNADLPGVPGHRRRRTRAGVVESGQRLRWPVYDGHLRLLCVAAGLAFCGIAYYTHVKPLLQMQILLMLVVLTLARSLMALALFRHAAGRRQMLWFAYSMGAFAALNVYHLIATFIYGAPPDLMKYNGLQTAAWVSSLIFTGVNGMFYLTMINTTVNETIEEKSMRDFLTSTLNRRGIEKALDSELQRAHRTGAPLSILLIDVDHFKTVNDRFGHAAGDELLRAISASIATTVRGYDRLGRFGGDEFLLLLPETSADQAMFLANRLLIAVRTMDVQESGMRASLSVGVTHSVTAEETVEIFRRADAALYQAKQAGRNCARLQMPVPTPPRVPSRELAMF